MLTRLRNLAHNLAVFTRVPIQLQENAKAPPAGAVRNRPAPTPPPPAAATAPAQPASPPIPAQAPPIATPAQQAWPPSALVSATPDPPRLSLSATNTIEHLVGLWQDGGGEKAVVGVQTLLSETDKKLLPALTRFIAAWREAQGSHIPVPQGTPLGEALAIAASRTALPPSTPVAPSSSCCAAGACESSR